MSKFLVLQKIIKDLFKIEESQPMFLFIDLNNKVVFLNDPCKTPAEQEHDLEIIKNYSFMNLMSFDRPELFFVTNEEDNWYFSLKIQRILQRKVNESYPTCVHGRYLCPPYGISFSKFKKVIQQLSCTTSEKYAKYCNKYHEWKNKKFNKLEADFPSFNVFNNRIRFVIGTQVAISQNL